ncbi:hypothetical protein HAZT_HAZT011755 [Hyalella azteca]|uniref:Ig-like domain-containing protein n=1 Tax=Hyalella azteca TaxID=294128 RepID=A0A6A0H184_HYAAZ|nr:hypothetical protein HAZT_HAZT011755 [Hyalella azteca]
MYHGAARHEQVNIPCHLESHPLPHTFTWTFNNSGESVKIPQDHVTVSGAHSTVSYTPMTELDYGTLLCWGSNAVGKQRKPCVYHVFPAGMIYIRYISNKYCNYYGRRCPGAAKCPRYFV